MTTTLKYVCPMHPEITTDTEGNCSICGMSLVKEGETAHHFAGEGEPETGWRSYLPLFVVVAILTAAATITSAEEEFVKVDIRTFLLHFMTGFFLVFGGFKLLDLKSFADGYSTYDLLAVRWRTYGYIYPFIEIAFGLVMLAGFHPDWLLWTEFALMTFSGTGVAVKILKKQQFMCVCLGTVLKVPLTYVTLIEDFGMAAIALLLIFMI